MNLVKTNFSNIQRFCIFFKTVRLYRSVIYLSGERATDTCAVVTPQIDVEGLLSNSEKWKNYVEKRGVENNIDSMMELWKFLSIMNDTKKALLERRQLIVNTMNNFKVSDADSREELDKLKIHFGIMKEDIKALKQSIRPVEENFMINILSLPNSLHYKTPCNENVRIETYDEKPSKSENSHIAIGKKFNILNYSDPYNYYLKNDGAIFELSAKFYFSDQLKSLNYIQFSNPDFTKSAVVEGCGVDYTNPNDVFILHQKEDAQVNEMRLHLTGGGSLFAFIAYHTRNIVLPQKLPFRYYCMGRQYNPVPQNSDLGLFQVSQASVIEIFVATTDCDEELNKEINKVLNDVTSIYKKIGYHFRTSYCHAKNLKSWECLKISIEMFSPHLNRYIEVGYVSVSDNYISKRLQFSYKDKKIDNFPKIISGTILNVPKLLGCALEYNPDSNLQFPSVFKDIF